MERIGIFVNMPVWKGENLDDHVLVWINIFSFLLGALHAHVSLYFFL